MPIASITPTGGSRKSSGRKIRHLPPPVTTAGFMRIFKAKGEQSLVVKRSDFTDPIDVVVSVAARFGLEVFPLFNADQYAVTDPVKVDLANAEYDARHEPWDR